MILYPPSAKLKCYLKINKETRPLTPGLRKLIENDKISCQMETWSTH